MALGNNGDLYVNKLNGDYYAKVDGVWVLQGNLMGPKGDDGGQGVQGIQGLPGTPGAVVITSDILFGEGVPDNGDGTDGQVYVDTDTETVYKKISGVWEEQTNLKGESGRSFLSGNGVPDDSWARMQTATWTSSPATSMPRMQARGLPLAVRFVDRKAQEVQPARLARRPSCPPAHRTTRSARTVTST